MKWLFIGWLQFHLRVPQEEGQRQKCPFNFSNSKDRSEPQHNYSQRISAEKVLQVHWGHKELNSRNNVILSAAFYPQHWAFNSPEPFRWISRAGYCCSRQAICRHPGDLLGSCLLLLWDPASFFAFQFPEHLLWAKKCSTLLLLLSQQLLTESQQYKRQQTQRQPLF